MQFKDIGKLFDVGIYGEGFFNISEEIKNTSNWYKGAESISEILNMYGDSFNKQFKIGANGVSEFTKEQIRAKASVLGLTDSLTSEIVALGKDATFTDKVATGKLTWGKALANAGDNVNEVGKALLDSGKLNEAWSKSLEESLKTGNIDNIKNKINGALNSVDGLSDSFIDLGNAGKTAGASLSDYFIGLYATIKPLLPLMIAVGAAFAAFAAWDYSQHGFTRAQKDAENAASEYENVKSNLQSLNSELDTTKSKIQELESLQSNGTISFAQEIELENLKNTNNELERQVDIQKSLLEIKKQASAQAAVNASNKEQTYTEVLEEEYGSFAGKILGFLARFNTIKSDGEYGYGNKVLQESNWTDKYNGNTTIQGQVEGNVKALEEYKNELIDIENQLKDNPTDEALLSREEELNKLIDDTTISLADQSATLQGWIDACTDENGAITKGFEKNVEAYKTSLTLIQNVGKSQKQIDFNNLNNYFSSTGGRTMKKYLEDIVKSGGSAEDALKAFKETGMSLDEIGVSSEGFVRYFQDLAKSATDASNAVEGFDGSLESIKKAGETDNRDKDWNTVSDLFKKAIELDKNKKWGTDDFQSMAQFIAPEGVIADIANADLKAKDYKDLWDKYYSNFKKYFDSEKPLQSAINAQDKLISSGLATRDKNGIVSWTEEFKSSTDAANAWGVSVEAAEVIMRNLESHGAEFDGVRFDNEELDKYKSSLEGIRSIYETLDDGAEKDRLGELLKSFESEYEIFEKDLTQLSEDQIVKIKFEYDLASIQQKIQELKDLASATGDNKDWAAVTVAQKQEREMLEEKTGYTKESDSGYSSSYDKISNLRTDMVGKTEDERAAINAQISAIQELQNAFQSFRLDGGQLDWSNYLQSDEATKTLKEIEEATHLTKEQITDLLGIDVEYIKIDIDKDDIEKQLKEYSKGGNVDLTLRPVIDSSELVNAGWDVPAGEAATVFSSTFSNEAGNIAMNFTPIMTDENGNYIGVMSPEELQKYAEEVIAGTRDDDLNLKIGATYEGDDAIEQAVETAEKIHELHEDYYIDIEANDNASDVIKKVSQEEIEDKIVKLIGEDDATPYINLWNIMSADTKFAELSADDQATLVLETYNSLSIDDKNSLISQTGGEATKGVADAVSASINAIPKSKQSTITITTIKETINKVVTKASNALSQIQGLTGLYYSGTMSYPSHAYGTAYNVINTKPISSAFANGKVSLSKDEMALVNELGNESIIRDGKWLMLPPGMHMQSLKKGDIVLSAAQTASLLNRGKASGVGHAYAHGTLLSSAYGDGMPYLGGNYGTSYGNTNKNPTNNKNNNNSSSSDKDFEEVKDWVKIYLEEQSRITDRLVNAIDDMVGLSAKQAATDKAISQVQAEIVANQKAYNVYKQKADSVELSQSYKNQVINGTLNIETITDENLKNTIDDFEKWHDEMVACEDKIEDLKDQLKDLAQTKFDNVTTEFENQISLIEHEIKLIELSIDEMENRGYLVSTKFYNDMIKNETDNLNYLKNEYATLTSTLQSLLDSGMVERYSDQWFEMMSDINDVSEAIQEANNSLIEYQNNIRDLNWEVFDKLQEKISTITSESEFLIKLLSDGKLFDSENAKITKQGQAVLGLNVLNYNTLMAQADEYAKELAEIGNQLELDPNNLDLAERYNDLLEKQQNAILDANSAFEDAISIVEDGFDVFIDSMDKLISKRKDELNAIKDLHDYEKNVAEQTKEIASLEKQLKAFQGDTSESTRATIQQIKVSLEEAKMNLEETEYDRYIKDQEELFDKLKDDTEEWMNQRMDDRDWLLQQLIDYTNENADSINEAINSSAESVGYDISDAMNAIWSPGGTYSSVVAGYADNFSSQLTTTNSVLNDIRSYMAKLVGESDKKAEEITNESKPVETPTTPAPTPTPAPPTNTNNSSGDGVPSVGDAVTFASGKYYYSSDGINPSGSQMLGQTVYISKINNESWATKPYHITKNKDGSSPLGWVSLDQLTGYRTGGLVDETGLAMLHGSKEKPELVLNAKDTENFMELTDALRDTKEVNLEDLIDLDTEPEIIKQLKANLPNLVEYNNNYMNPLSYNGIRDIKPRDVSTNVKIEIGDIQMYGVNDPKQFAVQLKDTLLNDNSVKKIIQSDTLGLALGKNSLSKFKYR